MPRRVGRAQQELAETGAWGGSRKCGGYLFLLSQETRLWADARALASQICSAPLLLQAQHSPLLASPSRTLQTASPDGHGCRLLPAHFPFPALSLSQGSSGKLAERDIFHALDSSAQWLSLPPLPTGSSPAGHPDPGEEIFGQLVAAHSPFNFICNFISLGFRFCEMS